MKNIIGLFTFILVTGCASAQAPSYQLYLTKKGLGQQTPQNFQHCHGYGCKYIADVALSAKDWKDIGRPLKHAKNTPEAEREAIKKTIAIFEQKVGQQTGTHVDQWGTFRKTGHHQLDCVDESTNTTIYLSLLDQKGLLRHHRVESPNARFPIIHAGRWPHQTAVISETGTKNFFVVDSWFHDNGEPAEIVGLKQWKEGWKPNRADETDESL